MRLGFFFLSPELSLFVRVEQPFVGNVLACPVWERAPAYDPCSFDACELRGPDLNTVGLSSTHLLPLRHLLRCVSEVPESLSILLTLSHHLSSESFQQLRKRIL